MNFQKSERNTQHLTETRVREIVDDIIRKAIREQARDLEKHLVDIHKRLVVLEK